MLTFLTLLLGLLAGFFSGFFGIGGGAVFVPALLFIYMSKGFDSGSAMLIATGTSLFAIMLSTSSAVTRQIKYKNIRYETAAPILIGVILSSMFGVIITNKIGGDPLRYLLAIFNFWAATRMFKKAFVKTEEPKLSWDEDPKYKNKMPLKIKIFLFGLGIIVGVKSAMLGIGGGVFVVAGLIAILNYKPINATATSVFIALIASIIGLIFRMTLSTPLPEAPPATIGTVNVVSALMIGLPAMIGAQIGVYIHNKMEKSKWFYIGFAVLLTIVALKMIFV